MADRNTAPNKGKMRSPLSSKVTRKAQDSPARETKSHVKPTNQQRYTPSRIPKPVSWQARKTSAAVSLATENATRSEERAKIAREGRAIQMEQGKQISLPLRLISAAKPAPPVLSRVTVQAQKTTNASAHELVKPDTEQSKAILSPEVDHRQPPLPAAQPATSTDPQKSPTPSHHVKSKVDMTVRVVDIKRGQNGKPDASTATASTAGDDAQRDKTPQQRPSGNDEALGAARAPVANPCTPAQPSPRTPLSSASRTPASRSARRRGRSRTPASACTSTVHEMTSFDNIFGRFPESNDDDRFIDHGWDAAALNSPFLSSSARQSVQQETPSRSERHEGPRRLVEESPARDSERKE